MKKIQTAINKSIGNHESKTPKRDGIFSSIGAAEILTPLSDSFSIRFGSSGEYVEKEFPCD
jgi:acyl carrier protein